MITRDACAAKDIGDPLAPLRQQFDLHDADARRTVYLDGNSLGVLPRTAAERVRNVVESEWGAGLIRSWNEAGWITLSQRIGNKIARLVGAGADELIVADSTSINLFKVLSAAAAIGKHRSSGRSRIVFRADLVPDRSLYRQRRGSGPRARTHARQRRRCHAAAGRARRDPAADARALSQRPHPFDARDHPSRARGRSAGRVGSVALGWSDVHPARGGCR